MSKIGKLSENHNKLLISLAEDDESAFEKLYYMYYDRLFRFAIHIVKNEMSGEEVVSDVFFNIWQNRKKLPSIADLDAYLYKSVKNMALNYLDKENRRPEFEELSVSIEYVADDRNPEDITIYDELNRILTETVESLPDRCRIIFKLAREDGFKYREISEILGISVKTIDAQMSIAKQKIEEVIKKWRHEP
jgi:RNA polymerase sigma-70 factor (ECF subfamily)